MKAARCPRLWEGEALSDGRLSGEERASFERHAASCAQCQGELVGLARLRDAMASLVDPPKSTPFERQARRTLLLRTANDRLVGASHGPLRRRALAWCGVMVAAIVLTLAARAWWRFSPEAHGGPPGPAMATPSFDVVPIGEATWTNRSADALGRVVLEQGTLGVHVRRLAARQHFLLTLPDGEIEVHGTRFIVEVASHRTLRVEVTEGVVSLRLPGMPEQRLDAGQRWVAPPASTVAASPSADGDGLLAEPAGAASRSADVALRPAGGHDVARSSPRRRPSDPARDEGAGASSRGHPGANPLARADGSGGDASPTPSAAGRPSPASARFAAAVDALEDGALARSEKLFADFARDFPGDERTEDACFLQAVARARSGDHAGAAALARSYLARFPQGLRRKEAERLVLTGGEP